MKKTHLPAHLAAAQEQIEGYARDYGLDFYPIIYEVLDYRTLYETASLGGFPIRYPHWRFGMEYDQLLKGHVWLGSTIYEMIINTNPAYGYLLEGNEDVTQKMVMAHVCGHVDFFKHNMWFAHTNRKMLDEMANHSARVWRIIDRYGYDVVEDFIDTCLSLENLIDYHAPYIRRPEAQMVDPIAGDYQEAVTVEGLKVDREYMREYINPPEFLEDQRQRLEREREQQKRFPVNPQKDILLFLLNYAPLERWQHTILNIVREESYYFAPQGMTKIMNEGWACMVAGSLMFTTDGIVPIDDVVNACHTPGVADGNGVQPIYDHARFADRATVRVRTRHGFSMEGSVTHRLLLPDGTTWRRLDELQPGDHVQLAGGGGLWVHHYVPITTTTTTTATTAALPAIAAAALPASVAIPVQDTGTTTIPCDVVIRPTTAPHLPTSVDERVGALLGYLLGSAQHNPLVRSIHFRTDSAVTAATYAALWRDLCNITATTSTTGTTGTDYTVTVAASSAQPLLHALNVSPAFDAVPDVLLRSPASVVTAFLDALCACAAHCGDAVMVANERIAATMQLLLLNSGILASVQPHPISGWLVTRLPADTPWHDEIVTIEHGRADVYDISVATSHRYAAQGFINHNSYWHSQIMTQRALRDSEVISFADLHSGVVATSSGRLNPYKLGLELLRDIEERWDTGRFGKEYEECDDIGARRNWNRATGLGRQKLFEVRRLYNDVTFIDEFLTQEFVERHNLFTFRYNRDTDFYEIASREFQQVKEKLLFQLTNFGQPYIVVEDANYNNRGELYLLHRHEGVDLQTNYARDTMRNLYKLWTRPIHVETRIEDRRRLLSYDGTDFHERRID